MYFIFHPKNKNCTFGDKAMPHVISNPTIDAIPLFKYHDVKINILY